MPADTLGVSVVVHCPTEQEEVGVGEEECRKCMTGREERRVC